VRVVGFDRSAPSPDQPHRVLDHQRGEGPEGDAAEVEIAQWCR
jgi:hypothetical protein